MKIKFKPQLFLPDLSDRIGKILYHGCLVCDIWGEFV